MILGHLVHQYEDGTETPVSVQLKSLGNGTVITGILDETIANVVPTGDSSSETSSTPDPYPRGSSNSTRTPSPLPHAEIQKIVDGDHTFVITSNQERRPSKRRQSGHRKEFHNVRLSLSSTNCS
jgi:hypothetical protein